MYLIVYLFIQIDDPTLPVFLNNIEPIAKLHVELLRNIHTNVNLFLLQFYHSIFHSNNEFTQIFPSSFHPPFSLSLPLSLFSLSLPQISAYPHTPLCLGSIFSRFSTLFPLYKQFARTYLKSLKYFEEKFAEHVTT